MGQEVVASTGLMEHLLQEILKGGFRCATSLQVCDISLFYARMYYSMPAEAGNHYDLLISSFLVSGCGQINFDLLGELIKFNKTLFLRLDRLLTGAKFDQFLEVRVVFIVSVSASPSS